MSSIHFKGDVIHISRKSLSLTADSKNSFFHSIDDLENPSSLPETPSTSPSTSPSASVTATVTTTATAASATARRRTPLSRSVSHRFASPSSPSALLHDDAFELEIRRVPQHLSSVMYKNQRLRVNSVNVRTRQKSSASDNDFFVVPASASAFAPDPSPDPSPALPPSQDVAEKLEEEVDLDPDPDAFWSTKNKFQMFVILLCGVGIMFSLIFYFEGGIEHTEESVQGLHEIHMHEYPQTVHSIVGLSSTSPFFLESDEANSFDVKLVGERLGEGVNETWIEISVVSAPTILSLPCSGEQAGRLDLNHGDEAEYYKNLQSEDLGVQNCESTYGSFYWMLTTNSVQAIGGVFEVDGLDPIADHRVLLSAILLVLVYAFIIWDVVHRTLVALVGSFLALFLLFATTGEGTSMEQCIMWMDEGTLALLFGMMIMVNLVSTTGVFEWAAVHALEKSNGRPGKLLVLLVIATGVFSAFLDNVTTMLLLAPVTIELCKVISLDPIPLLMSEIMFSNLGGASTMIGDPPNIIIGSMLDQYVSFVDFIANLMPAIIISSLFCLVYFRWHYKEIFDHPQIEVDYSLLRKKYYITKPVLFAKSGTILAFCILFFFLESVHHVTTAWVAVIGATAMMLVASPHELHNVLESVEWETLLFFAALFVMIEAMAEMGLIDAIGNVLSDIIAAADESQQLNVAIVVIIWISAICSGFVDNIPFTTTMIPVITKLSEDLQLPIKPLIWSLSLGACLGGNLTIIGASANLVTVGIAESSGYEVTFLAFMRIGAPIMFISVTVSMIYALVVYGVLGAENDVIVGLGNQENIF